MVVLMAAVSPNFTFAQVPGDPYFSYALGPAVRIISPPNHAVLYAPTDIPILAYTRSEGVFSNVEFYANGVDLGPGTRIDVVTPVSTLASPDIMGKDVLGRLHALWCFDWTNAQAGSYALTAVARGLVIGALDPLAIQMTRTSPPVNIIILPPPPPTNNLPDVVNIFATDPIAIAGTNNFWIWKGMTNATPAWTAWPPPNWEWFTNWGPKSALFTVHRFGDVSSNLTVNYSISGTASNGVDYFALPGHVDIPAGYNRALIPIIPIDHGSNSPPKTVILTLMPDTNAPPDYFVGCPPRAEALILENWLRPLPWLLPDGTFHLGATGPDGAWFSVESSTDLQNWSCISTNQVIDGSLDVVYPNGPNSPNTFYLTVQVTNTPSN